MSTGSIIIAAHNEEAVIGRTLDSLSALADHGDVRVIVVCNGCTDRTAEIAAGYGGVELIELDIASKTAALRAGDRAADSGPRIYLDADVVLTSRAALAVLRSLSAGSLAGRPPHVFDTTGASWIVRRWYNIRGRLPSISSALWGAGCYALSSEARARFDEFPELVSDDLFIDSLIARDDVVIIDTDPVVVTTPRRLDGLRRILQRSYRTQHEVQDAGSGLSGGQRGQLRDLRALVARDPKLVFDAAIYVAVIAYARIRAKLSRPSQRWERDTSSRELR